MPDLSNRSQEAEWMDGEDVSQRDFAACLADLAQVNTLTLARGPTLGFVDAALAANPREATLTVLDVGFGAGDMLRAIAKRARARHRSIRAIGIDLNPRSEPAARSLTSPELTIEYRTGDLFAWPQEEPVDLVVSSLVTHHMTDAEIGRFLGWMETRARLGWFINDLHRHPLPYHGFHYLASVMRWHRFVRHDGPLSIARAFRREDWQRLLQEQRLAECARIHWHFPFRLCVERRRW